MANRRECPNCKVTLRLPDSGLGRCPQCQTIVRAEPRESPPIGAEAEEWTPLIPEISADDEAGPAARTEFAPVAAPLPPHRQEPPLMPPPLPRGPRRETRRSRRRGPDIDIANPPPPPSKTLPIILLTLAFVISLVLVIGSFIYLVAKARDPLPPPPMGFPRR